MKKKPHKGLVYFHCSVCDSKVTSVDSRGRCSGCSRKAPAGG